MRTPRIGWIKNTTRASMLVALLAVTTGCFETGARRDIGDGSAAPGGSTAPTTPVSPPPPPASPAPPAPSGALVPPKVTVTGRVAFDRVPFGQASGAGLDYAATVRVPARGVPVAALSNDGYSVLATDVTDANGEFRLSVPALTLMIVRAFAESPGDGANVGRVSVRDNTAGGLVHYADSARFDSGVAASRRDVIAASGWNGTRYANPRRAAPFALLETAGRAAALLRQADPQIVTPPLDIYWSPGNLPELDPNGAVDVAGGRIGATHATRVRPWALYVLGAADVDTDEYDEGVLLTELGRLALRVYGRDDSFAEGDATANARLDGRLVLPEAWARSFASAALGNPRLRNSRGAAQGAGVTVDLEAAPASADDPGWYRLASVQSVLHDLHDSAAEAQDSLALGFGPLLAAARAGLRDADGFASVHALGAALVAADPATAAAITQLFATQNIAVAGADPLGLGEQHDGGETRNLPIYERLAVTETKQVCSLAPGNEIFDRLGNRRFIELDVTQAANYRVTATGPADSNPELVLHQRGIEIDRADVAGSIETLERALEARKYVLEVYESSNVAGPAARGETCIDVALEMI